MLLKIRQILKNLGRLEHLLFGTGSWSLKPYEQQLIEAVLVALDLPTSQKVREQLGKRFFVDRVNDRIHTLHFDHKEEQLMIREPGFDDTLFKLSMRVDGKRQTGRVTFFEGYIFSVETPKPEKTYRNTEIEVLKVERAHPKASLTHAIDRLEHGKDGP